MKWYCFCWKMRQGIVHATVTGMLIYLPEWTHCLASEYAVLSLPQTHPQFPQFCSAQSHWQEHRKSHNDSQCPWKIATMHPLDRLAYRIAVVTFCKPQHTLTSALRIYYIQACLLPTFHVFGTIGLFSHLLCTTNSRLVAATRVLGLVQRPSGVQLLSCSCVTLCTWPDWRWRIAKTPHSRNTTSPTSSYYKTAIAVEGMFTHDGCKLFGQCQCQK